MSQTAHRPVSGYCYLCGKHGMCYAPIPGGPLVHKSCWHDLVAHVAKYGRPVLTPREKDERRMIARKAEVLEKQERRSDHPEPRD